MPDLTDDGVPVSCHHCGGPLPAARDWWLRADAVYCSLNCADGDERD